MHGANFPDKMLSTISAECMSFEAHTHVEQSHAEKWNECESHDMSGDSNNNSHHTSIPNLWWLRISAFYREIRKYIYSDACNKLDGTLKQKHMYKDHPATGRQRCWSGDGEIASKQSESVWARSRTYPPESHNRKTQYFLLKPIFDRKKIYWQRHANKSGSCNGFGARLSLCVRVCAWCEWRECAKRATNYYENHTKPNVCAAHITLLCAMIWIFYCSCAGKNAAIECG